MNDTNNTGQGVATVDSKQGGLHQTQDFVYTPKEPSTTRLKNMVQEWKREVFVSGTLK